MSGRAMFSAQWVLRCVATIPSNQFSQELIERFDDSSAMNAYVAMHITRQTGSLEDYLALFEERVAQPPELPPDLYLGMFLCGLHDFIRDKITESDAVNVFIAIRAARRLVRSRQGFSQALFSPTEISHEQQPPSADDKPQVAGVSEVLVQEYIAKGKFLRSGQHYGLLHKCPSPSLNVILMGIDDVPPEDTDEGEQENTCNLDEPLCKLCQTPCKGNNEKVPQYFEDLLCNLDCFEEYRSRTSNRFIREEIFKIERGICTNCKLKCHQLVKDLKLLSIEKRQEYIRKVAPTIAKRQLYKLVHDPSEGNAWHANHIIPAYKGRGECKLENMRTLCVACHADVTTAVFRTAFCQEQGKGTSQRENGWPHKCRDV
ncbi:hypothetical protein OROHE_007463 [Orobanche hederae]